MTSASRATVPADATLAAATGSHTPAGAPTPPVDGVAAPFRVRERPRLVIVDDLVGAGLLDPAAFEETFVAVVEDVDPGWTAFYRNTLAALARGGEPGGTNAGIAPVHDRAAALTVGPDVVELGCCFGFLSLRLAAEGHRVTAGLIGSVSRRAARAR